MLCKGEKLGNPAQPLSGLDWDKILPHNSLMPKYQIIPADSLSKKDDLVCSEQELLEQGREVLQAEILAVQQAAYCLDSSFVRAVKAILSCRGRVCVTGIGKAGIIGKKIQGTLASTGTPAYGIHPVEALHGDLGMVHQEDVVIALSKSGGSEVAQLVPILKKMGCCVILITAEAQSSTAQQADIVLSIGSAPEACPLGLAPSSSTTAMLAIGDALALTVMRQKAVKPEQYAAYHPAGALGRALMKVRDIMRRGANCPVVLETAPLTECYQAMLQAPLRSGAVLIKASQNKLLGILTQGDVFRLIAGKHHTSEEAVSALMTRKPKQIEENQPVVDALALMREYSIDELPVVDAKGKIAGLLDVQDLIRHGFPIAESI